MIENDPRSGTYKAFISPRSFEVTLWVPPGAANADAVAIEITRTHTQPGQETMVSQCHTRQAREYAARAACHIVLPVFRAYVQHLPETQEDNLTDEDERSERDSRIIIALSAAARHEDAFRSAVSFSRSIELYCDLGLVELMQTSFLPLIVDNTGDHLREAAEWMRLQMVGKSQMLRQDLEQMGLLPDGWRKPVQSRLR